MSELTIKTNNTPRLILNWDELTVSEQSEFDYIDPNDGGSFFRYKGFCYGLHEFERINNSEIVDELQVWEGIKSESYFSGILLKIAEDGDEVIVGYYYCQFSVLGILTSLQCDALSILNQPLEDYK